MNSFTLLVGLLVVMASSYTIVQVEADVVNVVLLGATGNLAEKYLWQGLYNIRTDGLSTGDDLRLYPAATKGADKASPILERILKNNITEANGKQGTKEAFLDRVNPYVQLRREEQYEQLGKDIAAHLAENGENEAGRLFYLSVPPKFFGSIAQHINKYLRPTGKNAWLRVIVEKPFGVDLDSAKELASDLYKSLKSEEILLVDHYMGKAGIHAIRDFVHQNPVKSYLSRYLPILKKIEVGMLETDDCKGRTGFYDEVGVLRDTMQNHLMMMVALLTMDADAQVDEEADARKVVFEKLEHAVLDRVEKIGQYKSYNDHVNEDRAKWDEPLLEEPTLTPTYAHVVLQLESKPGSSTTFDRIPIHFKSGKALDIRRSYIQLEFKSTIASEMLIFNLQGPSPIDGVSGAFVLATSGMNPFKVAEGWKQETIKDVGHVAYAPEGPFAYEVLLRAGLEGEKEHFVRLDEVLESWRVWTPLLSEIEGTGVSSLKEKLVQYDHGSSLHSEEQPDGGEEEEEEQKHDEL